MAALNGTNYANSQATPRVQSRAGEVGGNKKILLDDYVGTPTAADTISIGYLPKGARVLDLKSIGMGTGASFSVAAGAIMSVATLVVITVGTSPAANPIGWIEYVID